MKSGVTAAGKGEEKNGAKGSRGFEVGMGNLKFFFDFFLNGI